jgi:hypothetical protein
MPAPTNATFFYMTDQRGTDRTPQATTPGGATSSSASSTWRYTK